MLIDEYMLQVDNGPADLQGVDGLRGDGDDIRYDMHGIPIQGVVEGEVWWTSNLYVYGNIK